MFSIRSAVRCAVLWAALASLLTSAAPALAARKLALVVGIDNYDNVSDLKKARGDAESVAKAFVDIGFDDVVFKADLSRREFTQVWSDFLLKINEGDTIAFFYSGHGVEISGQNFLVPSDVPKLQPGRDEQLRRETLSLSEFLLDLRSKKPGFALIIVDACRENPFERLGKKALGSEAGLANPEPPQGTFMMYSAGQGQFALDRLDNADSNPNSIYTRNLLPLLRQPGLTLNDIAISVRSEVKDLAATVNHTQTPAYYDQLISKSCLFGTTCGGAVEDKPNLAEGLRLAANQNYSLAINKHFRPLAESGDREAAVALWQLYDRLEKRGDMLDWLEKAGALGDGPSKVNLAWAHAKKSMIERLPREWQSRLSKAKGRELAQALIKDGNDEGAVILYAIEDEARNDAGGGDSDGPVRALPAEAALREAAQRGYPGAMVRLASVMSLDAVTDANTATEADRARIREIVGLYVAAARKGNMAALDTLLMNGLGFDDDLLKKLGIHVDLTDEEIAALLPATANLVSDQSTFDNIRASEQIEPSEYQARQLAEEWARRQLLGVGFARDPAAALKTIEEVAEPLLEKEAFASNEGMGGPTLFVLKGRVLDALGQPERALAYYLGTAEEYQNYGQNSDVGLATGVLDRIGWTPQREAEVARVYQDACTIDSISDDPSDENTTSYSCYVATRALILGGHRTAFPALKKKMREYFVPEYGNPPEDDAHKAMALFLKAKMGETDAGMLDPGETVEKLMGRSAALGSKDAIAWYSAKGLSPPKLRAQLEYATLGTAYGNWEPGQRLENKAQIACYLATTKEGVVTPAGGDERRPRLGLISQSQTNWGIGNVFYDVGLDGAIASSVRVFIDAIEFKTTQTVTSRRITFTGDQRPLISKLAGGTDIRIEFKTGKHTLRDTHSLIGFTDTYRAMLSGCQFAKSAF